MAARICHSLAQANQAHSLAPCCHWGSQMQSGLYVALSSQMALERRLTTIADNIANVNTAGFRASHVKFNDVLTNAGGTKVNYVSKGAEYLSAQKGAIIQTGNPLDFAIKGNAWFSIETPSGPALTRDGRFSMTETGDLVSIEGFAVLDAGGGPIQLNAADGPPIAGSDGTLSQSGNRVATLGLFEAQTESGFLRVGNTAIIPEQAPQPVIDRMDAGVVQGYVEQSNVNALSQITQMMMVSRAFENVTQLMRQSESSISDAIKTLGGAR